MPHVLLLFLDGVGIGADDPSTNPFLSAALPTLHRLLGVNAIVAGSAPHHAARASIVAVDATLGVDGTPQSGTGQATLLTGVNAVEMHGRHFGPWVPARLRTLVRERSVLARAASDGARVAFANAYPEEVTRHVAAESGDGSSAAPARGVATLPSDAPGSSRSRRSASFLRAGPPLAALGAGLLNRHTPELERGDAVASEITNEGWRERLGRTGVPPIDAVRAGRNLARIALEHDFTLFAHYATDYAGHRQDMDAAVLALEKVDSFIAGLTDEGGDDLLTIIVSDHGNLEDVTEGHTRNPAIGIAIGNGHAPVAGRLRSLMDVTPTILDVLSIASR